MGDKNWRTYSRDELRLFDDGATNAILYAMDRGAVGRMSSNNHMLLRSPEGTTISVSRNVGATRRIQEDVQRVFGSYPSKREARAQQQPQSDGSSALSLVPQHPGLKLEDPTLECRSKKCDAVFVTEGARYAHENSQHLVCEWPGCAEVFDWAPGRASHFRSVHEGRRPANSEELDKWLRKFLADHGGKALTTDVIAAGAEAGWTDEQLKRSKKRLKIEAKHPTFSSPWYWALPTRQPRKGKRAAASGGGLIGQAAPAAQPAPEPEQAQEHARHDESTREVSPGTPTPGGVAGVAEALEAIIQERVAEKDKRIAELEAKVDEMQARLDLVKEAFGV